jgi:hypothetical protein
VKFDALHVIQIWETALKSPFWGIQQFLGSRGPGFKSPRPDEKGQFWVLEEQLCAFFALAAQKSFSC